MITRLLEAIARREKETGVTISDADLARAASIKQAAVKYWRDNPSTQLKAENVFLLADYLNVNARWLATGEGETKTVGVSPDAKVLHLDTTQGIPALIRRLQILQTELQGILTFAQGLPEETNSSEQSHDMHVSSIQRDVEAARKLIGGVQQEGEGHGNRRNKKPSSGGGKN